MSSGQERVRYPETWQLIASGCAYTNSHERGEVVCSMKLLEEEYLFRIVNVIINLRKGYGEEYEKYLLCGINDSLKDI